MKLKSYIIISIFLFLISLAGFAIQARSESIFVPVISKPISQMTASELRSKIAEFIAVIQQLQTMLDTLKAQGSISTIPSNFSFSQDLIYGQSSADIKYLQIILNVDSNTRVSSSGIGSPGQESSFFGFKTKTAVLNFQKKYSQEIFIPLGSKGVGFVESATRAKLNQLLLQYKNTFSSSPSPSSSPAPTPVSTPNSTPAPVPTPAPIPNPVATPTPTPIITPTPTPTPALTPIPTPTPALTPTPVPTPIPSQADLYIDNLLNQDCVTYNYASRNCSGGNKKAYNTIQEGADNSLPGNTLLIRGGTYREAVQLNVNGQANNKITIAAYPGETPIIDGSEPIASWVKCSSTTCDGLKNQGALNPNYNNIYWADVDETLTKDPYGSTSYQGVVYLVENGEFLQYAQNPDQTGNVVVNVREFKPIQDVGGNYGQSSYLIDPDLNQPDDYWNGSFIRIWSHAANNWVLDSSISDFISAEHKIIFSQPLANPLGAGSEPDGYMIVNHPLVLDKAGEYFVAPAVAGKFRVYLWPRNTADLAGQISAIDRSKGYSAIYSTNTNYGNYITLDGLTINNARNGFEFVQWNNTGNFQGITIKNCKINRMLYSGSYINYMKDSSIENCQINGMKEDRGILFGNSDGITVSGNIINNTYSTAIEFEAVSNSYVVGNWVGYTGTHGNGITTYGGSSVLVADNTVTTDKVSCTLSDTSNIVYYNNVLYNGYGSGSGGGKIFDWGNSSGNIYVLNNVAIDGVIYRSAGPIWTIINNILEGSSDVGDIHNDNIFVSPRGSYGSGEFLETDLNKLFINSNSNNYQIKSGSLAINAGADISYIIPQLQAKFPNYNFYKDKDGNARPVGNWDIGAYEYHGSISQKSHFGGFFSSIFDAIKSILRAIGGKIKSLF